MEQEIYERLNEVFREVFVLTHIPVDRTQRGYEESEAEQKAA